MSKEYVTKDGLKKMEDELFLLKGTKRREIAHRIEDAKELGDLSENAEYTSAKDELAFNEGRIAELEAMIKDAVLINHHSNHSSVSVGSRVKIKGEGGEKEYTIVGSSEADPLRGKISNDSPFGRAFLGKSVGDEVEIRAPKGMIRARIVSID